MLLVLELMLSKQPIEQESYHSTSPVSVICGFWTDLALPRKVLKILEKRILGSLTILPEFGLQDICITGRRVVTVKCRFLGTTHNKLVSHHVRPGKSAFLINFFCDFYAIKYFHALKYEKSPV